MSKPRKSREWMMALKHLEESNPALLGILLRENRLEEYLDQKDRDAALLWERLKKQGADPLQIQEMVTEVLCPAEDLEQEHEELRPPLKRKLERFKEELFLREQGE